MKTDPVRKKVQYVWASFPHPHQGQQWPLTWGLGETIIQFLCIYGRLFTLVAIPIQVINGENRSCVEASTVRLSFFPAPAPRPTMTSTSCNEIPCLSSYKLSYTAWCLAASRSLNHICVQLKESLSSISLKPQQLNILFPMQLFDKNECAWEQNKQRQG